jgi:hypothetical protein
MYLNPELLFFTGPRVVSNRFKSTDPFTPPVRPMAPKPPKNEALIKKLREKTPIGMLNAQTY